MYRIITDRPKAVLSFAAVSFVSSVSFVLCFVLFNL